MRLSLTGGAYQAHSVIASAQRSVNLFSEPIPENLGEPSKSTDYPTPGLRLLSTIGSGPIRGIRQATNGTVYVVSGSEVYTVNTTSWVGTSIGSITEGLRTPVSMCDNTLDLVIVDGSANGWVVNLASNAFTTIPTTATQTPFPAGATSPIAASVALYTPFTPTVTGTISTATVSLALGYTGKLQGAIFDDAGGKPGTSLGIANTVINPATGSNTLTFGAPPTVTAGTQYWLGVDSDTTSGTWNLTTTASGWGSATAFADFPANNPTAILSQAPIITVTESNDPGNAFVGADRVEYLDTFLIFNKKATPQFYWTLSLAVAFDPLALDIANKSSFTDLLVTLVVAKREIWLLGELTTEIWYDVGATDIGAGSSQFAPVQSVFVDHGCAAKYSAAEYDNGVYWLTRDRQGHGFVVLGAGYQTKRISTYAIEAEIAGYARIDDAIGYCYQLAGHTFYVLTFPSADHTWVYDTTTGLWHEWLWIDTNGEEHRHRSNCYWPVNGTTPVVGDWQNGNLYALDNTVFTDHGQPIKRVRSFPHTLNDGKRVFYRQFLADIDAGLSSAVGGGSLTLLDASFSAPDGTNIDAYTSDVGGGWTAVGGEANAAIENNRMVGTGGDALYQSAAAPPSADYAVRYNVVPGAYDSVVSGTSLWVIGRATGADTGYRVTVSADGIQYALTLDALPGGASASVAMGTIASGIFTAWLLLRGSNITAQVQRSQDGMWLRTDGSWLADPGTIAAQFTDTTYTATGAIMIGGTWP